MTTNNTHEISEIQSVNEWNEYCYSQHPEGWDDPWGSEDGNFCRRCGGDCPDGQILCYECEREEE